MRKSYMINEALDRYKTHTTCEPWPKSTELWWIQGHIALCNSSLYLQVSSATHNTLWFWLFWGCSVWTAPSPAIIHPTKGMGRGNLNKLSLSFPWLTPRKRSRKRALGARAISRANSEKTHARERSHLHRSAHCWWRQAKARSLTRLLFIVDRKKKIVEIDRSKVLTRRNRSEKVTAKCGRVYCCGYGVMTFHPQAKQKKKRWAEFTRNWRRKETNSF